MFTQHGEIWASVAPEPLSTETSTTDPEGAKASDALEPSLEPYLSAVCYPCLSPSSVHLNLQVPGGRLNDLPITWSLQV